MVEEFLQRRKAKEVQVYLFGSRVWGKPSRISDFDLAVKGESLLCAELKEFLEESTFPYEVDVVPWEALSEELREEILSQGEKWI